MSWNIVSFSEARDKRQAVVPPLDSRMVFDATSRFVSEIMYKGHKDFVQMALATSVRFMPKRIREDSTNHR